MSEGQRLAGTKIGRQAAASWTAPRGRLPDECDAIHCGARGQRLIRANARPAPIWAQCLRPIGPVGRLQVRGLVVLCAPR